MVGITGKFCLLINGPGMNKAKQTQGPCAEQKRRKNSFVMIERSTRYFTSPIFILSDRLILKCMNNLY
jgi:hypothetical protein